MCAIKALLMQQVGQFKSMRKLFALLLFFFLFIFSNAQTDVTIHGTVTDSSGNSIQGATLALVSLTGAKDSSKTVSRANGIFSFSNVKTATFKIHASFIGYAPFTKLFSITESSAVVNIGAIELTRKSKQLEEVIIVANKAVQIKEDTIEFKADSFKLKPDADVEALLKKVPGIQVDVNGNVTAFGKSVTKVKVDGKDFFNGDIKTATKELPANIVDAVQVIDDYGDQAAFTGVKEGDPEKIINLKIKKDRNKGYFGRGQAGYGTDDRYTVNGSVNYFNNGQQISLLGNFNNTNTSLFSPPGNPGNMLRNGMPDAGMMNSVTTIMNNGDGGFLQGGQVSNNGISRTNSLGINFRDDVGKKVSVYGSYSFADKQTVTESSTQQTNIFNTGNISSSQQSYKVENSISHRLFLNVEWRMDSFNQIKISPGFSYARSNSLTSADFMYKNSGGAVINNGNSSENYDYTLPNFSLAALYNHRFKKAGRIFSVNVTQGYTNTDQDNDRVNNSIVYGGTDSLAVTQNQLILQDNTNPSINGRLSYIEPVTKKKSLEFNFTYNRSYTDNDKETSLVQGASSIKIDSLSNLYENTFTYQRYGINYRFNEKKYNYAVGLAAQANQMQGESFIDKSSFRNRSFNWFPVARFTYNFSRTRTLNLNYSAAVTAPAYGQLQPVYDYSNPQYPVIGNAGLSPEFRSTFSSRYNNFNFMSGNLLFANLSFATIKNRVVANAVSKTGTGVIQETRYQNANGYYTATAFFYFSKPYKNRKYVLSLTGGSTLTNDISFVNDQKNTGRNFTCTQGFTVDVRIKEWLEVGGGGNFVYNQTRNSISFQSNTDVRTYTVSSSGKVYLPGSFVINFDLNKSFNDGFGVTANPFIINAWLERQFSKKKQFSIRLQGYDLLKQNVNVSRSSSGNSIVDTRTNRLQRYFILSLNFKLQKFKGQQPKMQFPSGPPPDSRNL
jgi:Outer membrane protein beta-barrel family/Carboxypeptidase regulatory-like domain